MCPGRSLRSPLPLDRGRGGEPPGPGAANPLLEHRPRAGVDHLRRDRAQPGNRLAGHPRVAHLELEPLQLGARRCGHHVTVAHPQPSILANGLFEPPLHHRCALERQRPRPECPVSGSQRRHDEQQSDTETAGSGSQGAHHHTQPLKTSTIS